MRYSFLRDHKRSKVKKSSLTRKVKKGIRFFGIEQPDSPEAASQSPIRTPPVPQDVDERESMFIQPHDLDYVLEPMYPEYIPLEDEHLFLAKEQPLPPVVSPTAKSPGYVAESDPEEDPKEYEDDEMEDGPVDYPMDGGDDGDDDDGGSSRDDVDDENEDKEDEEEDEQLASADSAIVVPTIEPVSPPKGTKPVTPPPSTDIITTRARINVHGPSAHSLPPPVPSPLLPSFRCLTQTQTLRIASTQAFVNAVTTALPSHSLPPPSLYIPPPVDHRDDIEFELPHHKRSCLSTLGLMYEVEESSTARPTRGRGINYGFVSTLDAKARRRGIREVGYGIGDTWVDPVKAVPEIAPMTLREVNTKVIELVKLHEHDTQDLYALLEDAQDRLSQAVHYKLQTHREQVYAHESQIQAHQTQLLLQGTLIQTQHHLHETRSQIQQAEIAELQETDRRTEGVVGLTRWIEKMELVFHISGCAIENQVKFAIYTLLGAALTWWNGHIRTLGPDAYAMTWEIFKKKMTNKYCPQGEIKKLEIELWNLKTFTNETEKIDKYISGLPDNIYGNVKASKPKTLDETFELANDLMDQKLHTYAERQTENKRKADDSSRNNHGHQ
nr:hypothetical protein [Tanacetum cinerariifolium]